MALSRLKHRIKNLIARPRPERTKAVVLGNQKSGTSVIANLIADYSGFSKTIDLHVISGPTQAKLLKKEVDLAYFCKKYPNDFFQEVVKEPNLTWFFHDLEGIYPLAKFVLVIRDPRDNIRSMLNRINLPGDLSDPDIDSYDVPQEYRHTLDPGLYGFSSDHYIDILSERWNRVADVYLHHKDAILAVYYEKFCSDKVHYMDTLCENLGFKKVRDISDRVDIQYQPAGSRDVSWIDFFGRDNLSRIESICGERMKVLGYVPSA